ncbi:MAG TPA: type IV pilus assembly protein PilM [Halothiobacillaceae bacterium]|nr:type IV pilus assembly protein PilM [Halothiobacillaceae bacterium]
MPLLNFKPPKIGVDISSTSVKLVQLSKKKDRYQILALAVEKLPAGAVQGKSVTDIDAVAVAINRAVTRCRIKAKNLILAVPSSAAVSRVIRIENPGNEFELEEQVRMEADQHIPFPIEDVNFDFEPIETDVAGKRKRRQQQGEDASIEVLMAATRTDHVDSRVAVAEAAGMKVDIIDIESFALQNAFATFIAPTLTPEQLLQPVALFDIGDSSITINVFINGEIAYTREHDGGGGILTEDIAAHYGISSEEAEEKKINNQLPEDYTRKVLQPFLDTLAMNIERYLQYYYADSHGSAVNLILLAGGTTNTDGIVDRVYDETGIETRIANPLAQIDRGPGVSAEQIARHGSASLIAAGLALRSFD